MTLDQMKYFVAVATYQHVGRAAQSVHISPSVISNAVSTLESELQCKLFRKAGRRIELTLQGEKLLESFKLILSQVGNLPSELQNRPKELEGHFRICASHFLSSRHLLKGWQALQHKHPNVTADLYSMNTGLAIAEVLSGRIDLALCFSPLNLPDLKTFPLMSGSMVITVRKNHPILNKSKKEQLKFLAASKCIIHRSHQLVESCETHPVFDKIGFQPKVETYFDSDDIAIKGILDSDRWTFVPDVVVNDYKEKVAVIKISGTENMANYTISALIHKGRNTDLFQMELIEALKERF